MPSVLVVIIVNMAHFQIFSLFIELCLAHLEVLLLCSLDVILLNKKINQAKSLLMCYYCRK